MDSYLPVPRPELVLLGISASPSSERARHISGIREQFRDSELAIMGAADEIREIMPQFKDAVLEYLETPLDDTFLEIALIRMLDRISLKERTGTSWPECEPLERDIESLLETERFIIVKQMLDKIFHFINEIGKDVEDGVRYFQSTPYFVSIHNCDLKVVANDERYQKYFGNRVGKNSWGIFAGEAADPDQCPVGKTMKTGMVQRTNAAVYYPGGERVPVIVFTAPIYDNHGRMALILEVMAGSREINQLRKELRTTQQRYQKLFDEVPDYIAVLDRNLHITAANRRFTEAFGDRTGAGIFDVFTRSSFSEEQGPLAKTLADGNTHSIEAELITRDGRRLDAILSTAPVTTATGKLIQIIVIFKDVTEKRRLEDNLSTLGLMFSVVSHNIKNILTGLDAGLYHIDRGFYKEIPGEIEEGLEVATLMKERIRKLILDVLYYAKPRELQVERVDIEELVADIALQMQPKMGARDISFTWHVDESAGEFEADRDIFRSILLNLLENAMEACMDPHLERELSVELTAAADDAHVRFAVADNGVGIEESQRKQIFSKFFSTKGHRGTGLGLFIANQVVDQHGGKIEVSSCPGKGSRFVVIMPKKASFREAAGAGPGEEELKQD
jgi:PAS domain S-box-containing protein